MTKQELLQELSASFQAGEVTSAEIEQVVGGARQSGDIGLQASTFGVPRRQINIAQVLYYIGALIVLIGIVVLIGQNWSDLNGIERILVTLGAGIVAYISAELFFKYPAFRTVSYFAYIISAILIPFGMGVTLFEAGVSLSEPGTYAIIFGASLVVYFFTFILNRQNLFLCFSLIFLALSYYSLLTVFDEQILDYSSSFNLYAYGTMIIGAGYVLIGRGLEEGVHSSLTTPLYIIGLFAFLGSALSLGEVWDIIYPFIILGLIYLSIYLKSKTFLRISALFLMAYVIKITGEYFGENLGWPLALVLAGFLLIGIGYLTHYLNKRFILNPVQSQ